MKKKDLLIPLITLIVLGGVLVHIYQVNAAKHFTCSSTPTLFFHGWGSSSRAEEQMTSAARRAGVTNKIVKMNVSPSRKITVSPTLSAGDRNPIVEVNIQDNKLAHLRQGTNDYAKVYPQSGNYVKAAIQAVQKQTHSKSVNLVGHSMGNLEIMYYIVGNVGQKDFPQINHFVSIAGHYDGIIGENDQANVTKINAKTGKPSRMTSEYRGLLKSRINFPRQTKVLNIFGNLDDGSNSDGDVSNASSRSLKYLVNHRAASYQELTIHGRKAQHSRLHNNQQVNNALIKFLWGK